MTPDDSFSALATRLRADDPDAAAQVVARFARGLTVLARRTLAGRLAGKEEAEDAVQSALRSFFLRLRDGQFELADWNGLWGLLARITARKCENRLAHYRAARRDVAREMTTPGAIESALDRDPTPDELAVLAETLGGVLVGLPPLHQHILSLHLAGDDPPAIADRVGRSQRTVRRVLELVRLQLTRILTADPGD
jgi:RNA polymerase sigma-70 factor (ECF subfamily)